jgi:hypothetical protein
MKAVDCRDAPVDGRGVLELMIVPRGAGHKYIQIATVCEGPRR